MRFFSVIFLALVLAACSSVKDGVVAYSYQDEEYNFHTKLYSSGKEYLFTDKHSGVFHPGERVQWTDAGIWPESIGFMNTFTSTVSASGIRFTISEYFNHPAYEKSPEFFTRFWGTKGFAFKVDSAKWPHHVMLMPMHSLISETNSPYSLLLVERGDEGELIAIMQRHVADMVTDKVDSGYYKPVYYGDLCRLHVYNFPK